MILLLAACDTPAPAPQPSADTGEPVVCEAAELPVDSDYTGGFTGAEDFAFDAEGFLVSIAPTGDLVAQNREGETRVILPDATLYGAGTRFLPEGDIVFCDAETGSLVRVDPTTGASVVVLSGLEYPNGLDVDLDGYVYVAEQIAGRVRRIDPDTGEDSLVATGLFNPNGVTFSPDYSTIYVGSFGAGVVWAVDRVGEGWSEPRVYATTPEAPGVPPDWCDTSTLGAECPMNGGYGLGACGDAGDGDLYCASNRDYEACTGLAEGDACTSTRFGQAVSQACEADPDDGALFCPRTPTAFTDVCVGAVEGDTCEVEGEEGGCYGSWEGVLGCYLWDAWEASYTADCADAAEGDACIVDDPLFPTMGYCGDGSGWGVSGLLCWPAGVIYDEHGGLDGINVDACGDLYVTEYIQGAVWKFAEEGGEAERVAKLRSEWIPNMHWGNGVGGWEKDVLYVMDRERAGVFALEVGVEGHPDAFQPD